MRAPRDADLLKTGEVEVAISACDDLEARPWLERFPLFDEGFLLISPASIDWRTARALVSTTSARSEWSLPRHAEHGDALAASAPGKGRHDAWSDADMAALVGAGLGVAIAPRSFPRRNRSRRGP